jgi:uncharacterized protein (TIGR03435 family)
MCLTAAFDSAQSFDVVSIKPSDPAVTGTRVGIAPGGVFQARNVTLRKLIQQAYDVRDFQLSGGPAWANTESYDIEAKGNGPAVSEADLIKMTEEQRNQFQQQMLAKLRTLLTDRFQLKVRRETKEMPVYALVIAKNGPKIVKKGESFTPQTSLSSRRNTEGKTVLTGTDVPVVYLVRQLSNQVGRPVIDKTELKGNFDFKMTFAPDLADSDGPSIFTALEEELGLKLEPQRGPVEVIVMDAVEHPSPN